MGSKGIEGKERKCMGDGEDRFGESLLGLGGECTWCFGGADDMFSTFRERVDVWLKGLV